MGIWQFSKCTFKNRNPKTCNFVCFSLCFILHHLNITHTNLSKMQHLPSSIHSFLKYIFQKKKNLDWNISSDSISPSSWITHLHDYFTDDRQEFQEDHYCKNKKTTNPLNLRNAFPESISLSRQRTAFIQSLVQTPWCKKTQPVLNAAN